MATKPLVLPPDDFALLKRMIRAFGDHPDTLADLLAGRESKPALDTTGGFRDFLKANCTVVAPGETLVIRAPDLTPSQNREVMDWLNMTYDDGTPFLPFRTVVVPGEGLGVASETELKAALRITVREELAAQAAIPRPAWLAAVTEERGGGVIRLVHEPTQLTGTGPDWAQAVYALGQKLVARGKITINEFRAAIGLKPWAEDMSVPPQ